MKYLLVVKILFLSFILPVRAETIICNHPILCLMASEILSQEDAPKINLKTIPEKNTNLHHFDPTIKQIKQMLTADIVLLTSMHLTPWSTQIKSKREKDKLAVFEAPLNSNEHQEELSHFWLFSDQYCLVYDQLQVFLQQQKLKIRPAQCPLLQNQEFSKLRNKLLAYTVILTHSALEPLFEQAQIKVLALNSSHHHDKLDISKIKMLDQILSDTKKKTIWIEEPGILSQNHKWEQYRQKVDHLIKLDVNAVNIHQSWGVYEQLINELKKL